ncbi:MAG: DUF3387 domain-containing protein, partial [Candidatus Atribacteria bacterium]|nr:DUF3387 domain-containing protein [Candidatus Atribacteria bacterium]
QLGKAIIKEIFASSKRKKELELTDMEYAILNVLEERFESSEEFKEDVKELSSILGGDIFEGWVEQRSVHRKIEGSVRRFLRKKYYKRFDMNQEKFEELFQLIMSKVENYAE